MGLKPSGASAAVPVQGYLLKLLRQKAARDQAAKLRYRELLAKAMVERDEERAKARALAAADRGHGLHILRQACIILDSAAYPVGPNKATSSRAINRYNMIVNLAMCIVRGRMPLDHVMTLYLADVARNLLYNSLVSARWSDPAVAMWAAAAVMSPSAVTALGGRVRPDAEAATRTCDVEALLQGRCFNLLVPSLTTLNLRAEALSLQLAGVPRIKPTADTVS